MVEEPAGSREHAAELNSWVRGLLARVEDKWGVLILGVLAAGGLRYSELGRHLPGVSQRMLTLSLRRLERDGLVTRTVTPVNPPQVDYALTEVGLSLHRTMLVLLGWAKDHEEYIHRSRERFDAEHRGTG
ncbi:winged helix-turn-helix transcriptional regulator [Amycolatopsis silviterrae]|uniref:Winged helix-turn-helix transcriptional regulator n=1 Tax=Amycolatopsis silviterrae TaxID=1656914 RepID=A0ABW5HNQ3_9PSEU